MPANAHAHHVFPKKFFKEFSDAGININDPKFGTWWESTSHLSNAKAYNDAWSTFFSANSAPKIDQILEYGRTLMSQYGIAVGY